MEFSEVKQISTFETYDLRSRILRPNQPEKTYHYAEDFFSETFHLGIFFKNNVVCNGTFMKQPCPHFQEHMNSYRLRGMATDFDFQKMGLGSMILDKAQSILAVRNCDLLWFNARVSAEGFYQKLGFQVVGEIFDIASIGPHKVMYKFIKSR